MAENFDRLAAPMRELAPGSESKALSDKESAALPVQLDGLTLSRSRISTWETDAGHLDILVDMVPVDTLIWLSTVTEFPGAAVK